MKGKDFLAIADLEPEEIEMLVDQAVRIKDGDRPQVLAGKMLALIFEKPSLRTRVSFEMGIRQLGGQCVYLSKDDIGLDTREPAEDVARVLDRWVDGIVARVYSHRNLEILSEHARIPVINALSDLEHPCQVVGDLVTIQEHKGRFDGLRVAWVGDGNNVAGSLALACASVGADFTIASPQDYQLPSLVWEEAKQRAFSKESRMDWFELPEQAVQNADVVYTDTWVSMGHEAEAEERGRVFADYQVDPALVDRAKSDAIFMHDMPAYRGKEISDDMIDDSRSVVFDQAENRLHAQNAIMVELFRGRDS